MVVTLLQLVAVAWLPGAVIVRAPWGDRAARARLDAEERAFWAIVISVALSLAVALALAWAGRYTFGRLVALDVTIAAAGALAARLDLGFGGAAKRPRATAILPLALVALGLWRFLPPAEYIIGGKDPGVYMNEGIQIAQRGTFLYEDPLVASVPPFARDLFFPSHQRPEYYGTRFMGFFIIDPETGLVVGQFPHLFPAAIAIGYGLDGLTGARRTAAACAILGLLAVYFVGARLFGWAAGAAAAALLALNLVQVWFSKYPNGEVLLQPLIFAALLATARAHVDGQRFFAPVAGALLGLLLFVKIDGGLAVAGTLAGLGLLAAAGTWPRPACIAALLAVLAPAFLYLSGPVRAGTEQAIVFLVHLRGWHYLLLAAAGAAASALLVAAHHGPRVREAMRRAAPAALAAALILAAVYAMYFREPGGRLAAHDAYALRTFTSYYLTLPVLIAALAGYALAAHRLFWRAPALFTTVAVFSFFLFYKIRIVPDHFWMTRRFLPVILPGALLFAAAAALGGREGRRWTLAPRWVIGLVFLTLVGLSYQRASRPILEHVEFAGVIPRLERLAASLGDRDLLLVEARDAGTDVHTLALPLAYIYARDVLVLNSAAPDKPAFAGLLEWASTRYDRVLFLGAGGTDLLSPDWSARLVTSERFQLPEYDAPYNEFPRYARAKQIDFTIYELTPGGAAAGRPEFNLDIGVADDLNVLRFHAKEDTEGRTFRWSQDASYIVLPGIDASNREITLWLHDGGRPPAAPPADVTLALDGEILGTVRVTTGFAPHTATIPAALAERLAARGSPVRLELRTPTWIPEELLGTSDDRELGVMVDRITVQ